MEFLRFRAWRGTGTPGGHKGDTWVPSEMSRYDGREYFPTGRSKTLQDDTEMLCKQTNIGALHLCLVRLYSMVFHL